MFLSPSLSEESDHFRFIHASCFANLRDSVRLTRLVFVPCVSKHFLKKENKREKEKKEKPTA